MSVKGSDLSSLTLAIADLKAIDARLSALVTADPPIESDGTDLTAAIRESQTLVRAAIARLTGTEICRDATPNDAAEQRPGGTKRRVKIKAESETTVSAGPARVEAVARSGTAAPRSPGKSTTRGADRARGASTAAASAAPATTANAPSSSLLARLGAATPEPGTRHPATEEGNSTPATASARQADSPSAHDADDRLARLEAEIDSLTNATTGGQRSKSVTADDPAAPATNAAAASTRRHSGVALSAPVSAYQSSDDDDGAGDEEDDAEIVIVTDAANAAGLAGHGSSSARQGPRIARDSPPDSDADAEVEIVQPGTRPGVRPRTDGRDPRLTMTPGGDRSNAAASKPAASAKWRLFRGQ